MAVIEIANNLVDLTKGANFDDWGTNSGAKHYADILLAIEQQVSLSTVSRQEVTTVESNIALKITSVMPNQRAGFSFAVFGSGEQDFVEEGIRTYIDPEELPAERRASVSLPSDIFNTPGSGKYYSAITHT